MYLCFFFILDNEMAHRRNVKSALVFSGYTGVKVEVPET